MPASSTDRIPEIIGRYRILKQLGRGGMGSVYLAQDTELDRQVALKVPHLEGNEGSNVLERFYREARTIATLRHPHICPLYDIGEFNGIPYLTMAFIEGKSLAEYLREKRPSQRQAAILVRKVALALQEAHQRTIIHRDLKPANIMIDRKGEPIVMDFGLARRLSQTDAKLTQSGAVIGTPAYMPPEQISSSTETMGPACDIYSLGIIFYELLTGRLPFHGDVMGMLAQILTEEPPRPSTLQRGIDPVLEAICLQAIAKKPAERFASMNDMAVKLLDYLRGSSASEPMATTVCQAPPQTTADEMRLSMLGGMRSMAQAGMEIGGAKPVRSKKLNRRKRKQLPGWLWATLGGGGVVVLLGVVFLVWQWMRGPVHQAMATSPPPNIETALNGEGNQPKPQQPAATQPAASSDVKPQEKNEERRDQTRLAKLEEPERPPEATNTGPGKSTNATGKTPANSGSNKIAPGNSTTPDNATTILKRGQWEEMDLNRAGAWMWDPKNDRVFKSITGDTVKLNHAGMDWNWIRSKNMSIRCQVLIEGQRAAISVRNVQGDPGYSFECYREKNGMCLFSIGTMNRQTFLSLRETRRPCNTGDFITMRLTAENDLITAYANGQKLLEVRDTMKVRVGKPGISVYHSRGQFKKLEVMLLND